MTIPSVNLITSDSVSRPTSDAVSVLLVELAPDSALLPQGDYVLRSTVVGSAELNKRTAHCLVRKLLHQAPLFEGISFLEWFEELLVRYCWNLLELVRLSQWLSENGCRECNVYGNSDLIGRLENARGLLQAEYRINRLFPQQSAANRSGWSRVRKACASGTIGEILGRAAARFAPFAGRYLQAVQTRNEPGHGGI